MVDNHPYFLFSDIQKAAKIGQKKAAGLLELMLILCLTPALSIGLCGCSTSNQPSGHGGNGTRPAMACSGESYMITSRDGWAETEDTNGYHILRTTDGARSWTDVTPPSLPGRIWDCQFPKANLAWISFYEGGKTRLLLTTNAGKSWASWAPLGAFDNSTHNFFLKTDSCRFFNASNGLAMDMDVGACQATYSFFETHDGGLTWNPARFSGKYPISEESPGTIWGSDCDGSAVSYYPPRTIVIARGDLADEKPKGVVRLSLSTDSGKSWHELAFPLPEKYRDRLVQSQPPHFFDASHAVLPVYVLKDTTNGFKDGKLVFYSTSDGGNSWSVKRRILEQGGVTRTR